MTNSSQERWNTYISSVFAEKPSYKRHSLGQQRMPKSTGLAFSIIQATVAGFIGGIIGFILFMLLGF